MIKLEGLHKFFNKGKQNEIHVINDVSLDLPERGMVAIFGKSGCGKTTLLNVIGGLDRFESGSLTIEGESIGEKTDVVRNRCMGYIFQNYNLNKGETCFQNVADALRLCGMSDEAEISERVTAALANVDMEKYARRTPDTLSGGQQQRIAIARAIVKNPRIILADEPTGNLDEANTVMIMDLLKEIAKDHLVLLVTHEANLVDHYCDTVIELRDGSVVSVRHNQNAAGFAARDKNAIYLGELEHRTVQGEGATIDYYGDAPAKPIGVKIVNHGGKLYLKLTNPGVQLLDDYSEVKLLEGVFEERPEENAVSRSIDMSRLPPVTGTRHGRLFSFGSSLKSGYAANFKKGKKGKKALRACLSLFAAVVVLMTAIFGTAIGQILEVREQYSHRLFYVYTTDPAVSQKLNAALGDPATGVDQLSLFYQYPDDRHTVYFKVGAFETFSVSPYQSGFEASASLLDLSLTKELPLLAGKKEGLALEECLVSRAVADRLLENSSLGYIKEYKDLIGLVASGFVIDGKNPRVAGVVDSDEPVIYLTEMGLAKYLRAQSTTTKTLLASDLGITLASGKTVMLDRSAIYGGEQELPAVGDTLTIQGIPLEVSEIKRYYYDYQEWLKAKGIQKPTDPYWFFYEQVLAENPALEGSSEFYEKLDRRYSEGFYDFCDDYYEYLDEYLADCAFLNPDSIELWLAVQKGVTEARMSFAFGVTDGNDYYKATLFKQQNGYYPKPGEMEELRDTLPDLWSELDSVRMRYSKEFESYRAGAGLSFDVIYLLADSDYIQTARRIGETHPSALAYTGGMMGGVDFGGNIVIKQGLAPTAQISVDSVALGSELCYTVLHSADPELTAAWIAREFGDLTTPSDLYPATVTPDDIFESLISQSMEGIIASLVTLAILLAVMSLCMYFIMRSSLMSRIKEVGVYRAIGVSKKNLLFKFFVEALVLTTLTVFVGFALTSGFVFACFGISSLMASIFFYPWWLALGVAAILLGLCLLCGTLPVLSLLRKTPSEILAKYDI